MARLDPECKVRRAALAELLAERGVFDDADEARRWIMAGQVLVDGRRVDKPGTPVRRDADLRVKGRRRFASRGGYKLDAALDAFGVVPAGKAALDCGASTGGFTDCLVQRGAALVYAVEVGHGQLVGRLRADGRVRNLERTNLGAIARERLDPLPALVTLDLSYLSLTAALPLVAAWLAPRGEVLALFKPLFEVDDPRAGRTGQVADARLVVTALGRVLRAGVGSGLVPLGAIKLALRPRNGVHEFFLYLTNDASRDAMRYDGDALAALVHSDGVGEPDAAEIE